MTTAELQTLLTQSADTIDKLVQKNASLETKLKEHEQEKALLVTKVAAFKRKEECEKIANKLIEKGIIGYADFQNEVRKMAASNEELNVLQKAAEMFKQSESAFETVGDDDPTSGMNADQTAIQRLNTLT
ncbi:MAG: hypothetical protein Q8M92_01745 [Candidatus Subteraquimicrobiales bacterium]|nr:hypothetical protein [Candidatus Subteraquimicrobiales bacterium]